MATYNNIGVYDNLLIYQTSSISVSNFDYTNRYLIVGAVGTTPTFSGTTATLINSNTSTFGNVYVYGVSSASFTIGGAGSSSPIGVFSVPKTSTITYIGDNTASDVVVDLSSVDYSSYNVYLIGPRTPTNGKWESGLASTSNGYIALLSANNGASSVTVPRSTSNSNRGQVWTILVPAIDVESLAVGDVIHYSVYSTVLDLAGFKFSCTLKGSTANTINGTQGYAEFDFSSVSDGKITLGSNYGAYIALTNGTGTDIKYNRMMVVGDRGYGTSGNASSGGTGGLFGGDGSNGSGSAYGRGGTQTAGGAAGTTSASAGSFGTGGTGYNAGSNNYGTGGNGWYGGGGGDWSTTNTSYTNSGGGGGGSSFTGGLSSVSGNTTGGRTGSGQVKITLVSVS